MKYTLVLLAKLPGLNYNNVIGATSIITSITAILAYLENRNARILQKKYKKKEKLTKLF